MPHETRAELKKRLGGGNVTPQIQRELWDWLVDEFAQENNIPANSPLVNNLKQSYQHHQSPYTVGVNTPTSQVANLARQQFNWQPGQATAQPWTPQQNRDNFLWEISDIVGRRTNESIPNWTRRINDYIRNNPNARALLNGIGIGDRNGINAQELEAMENNRTTGTNLPPVALVPPTADTARADLVNMSRNMFRNIEEARAQNNGVMNAEQMRDFAKWYNRAEQLLQQFPQADADGFIRNNLNLGKRRYESSEAANPNANFPALFGPRLTQPQAAPQPGVNPPPLPPKNPATAQQPAGANLPELTPQQKEAARKIANDNPKRPDETPAEYRARLNPLINQYLAQNPAPQVPTGVEGKQEANPPTAKTAATTGTQTEGTTETPAQPATNQPRTRQQILSDLERVRPKNMAEYRAMVEALTPEELRIARSWNDQTDGGNAPLGHPQRTRDEIYSHKKRDQGLFFDVTGYLQSPIERAWSDDTSAEGMAEKQAIRDELHNERDAEKKAKIKRGLREFFLGKEEEFKDIPIGSPEYRALVAESIAASRSLLQRLVPGATGPADKQAKKVPLNEQNLPLKDRLELARDEVEAKLPEGAAPAIRPSGGAINLPEVPPALQPPPINQVGNIAGVGGPQAYRKPDGSIGARDPQTGAEMYVGTGPNGQPMAIDPRTGQGIPLNTATVQPGQGQQYYGLPGMGAYAAQPQAQPQQPAAQPAPAAQPPAQPQGPTIQGGILRPRPAQQEPVRLNPLTSVNQPQVPISNNNAAPIHPQLPPYQPGPQGFVLPQGIGQGAPQQAAQPAQAQQGIFDQIRNVLDTLQKTGQGVGTGIGQAGNVVNALKQLGDMWNAAPDAASKAQAVTNWSGNVLQQLKNLTGPAQQATQGVGQLFTAPTQPGGTGGPGFPGGGGGPGYPQGGGQYGPLPVWGVPMPYAENQYLRQFYEQTVPTLAERFTALGGGQRSSAFQGALGRAGGNLALDLAANRERYNQQQQAYGQQANQLAENQRQFNANYQAEQQQQLYNNQLTNYQKQQGLLGSLQPLVALPTQELMHRPQGQAAFASILGGLGAATTQIGGAMMGNPNIGQIFNRPPQQQ